MKLFPYTPIDLNFLDSHESRDQLCSWLKVTPGIVVRVFGRYSKSYYEYFSDIINKINLSQFKAIVQIEIFSGVIRRIFKIDAINMHRQRANYQKYSMSLQVVREL